MKRPAKVLFVGRSIAHFSYFDSIIAGLLDRGADVELLVDEIWSKRWSEASQTAVKEFAEAHPGLKTGWIVRRADEHRDHIFAMRELRSYRSYLTRDYTTGFYTNRWRQYLTAEDKVRVEDPKFQRWLKSPLAAVSLRWAELKTPPDAGITAQLKEKAPDVMLVTPMNMRFSEETDYVKAAKALGIPTGLPVLSWDNLSTKGLLHIKPDRVFVWNEFQHEDALGIHRMPRSRVEISGAPFFDKWFTPQGDLETREAFCARLGLDPARKILLYLGSSRNIAIDESWFTEAIRDRLAASSDPALKGFQIVVRPHPANAEPYKRLVSDTVKVWPENGELPETKRAFTDMQTTFRHADAAVGINTSGMIDSVLADVPTFSVKIERYADTQGGSKHFRYLTSGDALYMMDDLDQFVATLGEVAKGSDPKAENRRAFARRFARPRGLERTAGDVIAEGALGMAKVR
jgi:hypothetical protein